MKKLLVTILIILLVFPSAIFALPAFPGAEGMGAASIGGRDGSADVYIVDTLSDNPVDGSTFREACEASGPRYVVFAVSGIINLSSNIEVDNPYITIVGQTSPGGVTTAGYEFLITTHDVVITHMRFRLGNHGAQDCDVAGGAIQINGNPSGATITYNIILDHCSGAFGVDETVDVNRETTDVTFSWCLIGKPLRNTGFSNCSNTHNYNMLLWGRNNVDQLRVSLHHNFFGTAEHRSPEANYHVFTDFKNNVSYNLDSGYQPYFGSFYDSVYNMRNEYSYVNAVNNYYKRGPESNANTFNMSINTSLEPGSIVETMYASGNLGGSGVYRDEVTDPEWCAGQSWTYNLADTDWQSATPFSTAGVESTSIDVTVTTMDATYAAEVVAGAGATKCQSGDCRDSLDATIALEFTNGTGNHLLSADLSYPSDWPTYSTPTAPTDTDSDGMPDTWETSKGTNPSVFSANDTTLSGGTYSDLEMYIHELGEYSELSVATITGVTMSTGISISN